MNENSLQLICNDDKCLNSDTALVICTPPPMKQSQNFLCGFFFFLSQGERVAELILNHARANECKDAALFKKEMAELVDHALSSNTLSLGKV